MIYQNNKDRLSKPGIWFKGGGGGDSVDYAYNARMASVAEQAQAISNAQFDFWESDYKPLEQAKIAANLELIPSETELALTQNESALKLTEAQTADSLQAMQEFSPVRTKFLEEAANGVDIESRVKKAAADAAHSFMNSNQTLARNAGRMGINPNSGRFTAMMNENNSLNQAKTIASAKTQARENAEQENFSRLTSAMNYGGAS